MSEKGPVMLRRAALSVLLGIVILKYLIVITRKHV